MTENITSAVIRIYSREGDSLDVEKHREGLGAFFSDVSVVNETFVDEGFLLLQASGDFNSKSAVYDMAHNMQDSEYVRGYAGTVSCGDGELADGEGAAVLFAIEVN